MNLLRGQWRFRGAPIVIGALAVLPLSVRAQVRCDTRVTGPVEARGESWAPPLGRLVTVHANGISLREALTRLGASAGVRITYSADRLPLDRRVCIASDSARVGDLLVALLRGLAFEPVAAGNDLVVLAAVRTRPTLPSKVTRPDSVVPLEPVIVEALTTDPARRELPVVPGVLESYQLTQQSSGNLADALNGAIPGVWIWNASTSGLLTQYASVRGATSFGMSAPKVYIDGIEVANPYLLTRIPADAIDRIEVIRGPQGAALYGADAISGVTNIITRQGALEAGAPRFRIRSRFGLSSTDYPAGASLAQDHNLALQLGSAHRSAALDLSLGTEGDFIPGASSRHVGANGSLRYVGANSLITGTLRYSDERTRTPLSPVLSDSVAGFSVLAGGGPGLTTARPLDLQQFTAGMRASWSTGNHWTHAAVAGVDGYALSGNVSGFSAILSPADSALRAAGAGAVRGTVRMTSTASVELGAGARGAFTFAAEHTLLRQFTDGALAPPGTSRSSTGVGAQADVALHDRLFLTGGLRLEHNGTLESSGIAALPMLGGSWIASSGPVGVKFRAAYGRGIRWPDLTAPRGYWEDLHEHLEHVQLGPEMQAGVEGGVDLTLGRALLLQVTRFDQKASGLVQHVAVTNAPATGNPGTGYGNQGEEGYGYGLASTIQSVGVITNRGWELQASMRRRQLSLTGNLSLVDSRVRQLAAGYTGDLQPGDRVLAVPARIWGLTAAWTSARWSLSVGAAAANDWINYDRIALARASSTETTGASVVGSELRNFWRKYDGVPRLRAMFSRDIGGGLALVLSGENLLDRQIGEPDNITVLPGRTLTLGFRANF